VNLSNVSVSGSPDFSLIIGDDFKGELAPGASLQLGVEYSPQLGPAQGIVNIQGDVPLVLTVTGQGTVVGPGAQLDLTNNNLGGAIIGTRIMKADAITIKKFEY
jgi:hypothetical protein